MLHSLCETGNLDLVKYFISLDLIEYYSRYKTIFKNHFNFISKYIIFIVFVKNFMVFIYLIYC